MRLLRYIGAVALAIGLVAAHVTGSVPWHERLYSLMLCASFLALLRLMIGPTSIDRAAALKVISVIIVNFGIILAALTHQSLYVDISIAWAFQAFIGSLVIAKYCEGKRLDA